MTELAEASDLATTVFLAFLASLLVAACVITWLAQYGEQALAWLIAHPIPHPHFTWPAFSLPARVPPAGGHHRLEKPVIRVSDLLSRERAVPADGRGRHWDASEEHTGMFPIVRPTVTVDGELVAVSADTTPVGA